MPEHTTSKEEQAKADEETWIGGAVVMDNPEGGPSFPPVGENVKGSLHSSLSAL